uniref:Uncharacterized protein n=1 Tax=Oryza brachyantha TaxID=4533 RepID=J3MP08_ORYBR
MGHSAWWQLQKPATMEEAECTTLMKKTCCWYEYMNCLSISVFVHFEHNRPNWVQNIRFSPFVMDPEIDHLVA